MAYDPRIHHRHTIRLSVWDYSADGTYFVTVCADARAHFFGEVVDGHIRLNDAGNIVADTWRWLSPQYTYVVLDQWCVMPNHLHGTLVLTSSNGDAIVTRRKPVGRLIGAFKTVSTKQINQLRGTPGAMVWQRNFWERVVRDGEEMDRIRAYIRDNPANWNDDELNNDRRRQP